MACTVNSEKPNSILTFKTGEELASAFCSELEQLINSNKNDLFSIALSGGNTPKIIFKILSSDYKNKIDWKKVKLFWGDERCVPPENEESNYGTAKVLLFDKVDIPTKNIFRIIGENNPAEEAKRYSKVIKENVETKNQLPSFDLFMLGLGQDGHTASLFPDQMNLLTSDNICETAVHPQSKQIRVTITGKVINNSKKIIFLVSGKNKAAIVKRIFNDDNSKSLPAENIRANNGIINWYLDEDAAHFLK